MLAIQLHDTDSEQSAKRIAQLTATVEDRGPESDLLTIVEH